MKAINPASSAMHRLIKRGAMNIQRFEDYFNVLLISLLFILPILEIVLRNFLGLPGLYASEAYSSHLLFILALSAGLVTQRQHMHLSLNIVTMHLSGLPRLLLSCLKLFWAISISVMLIIAGTTYIHVLADGSMVGLIPQKVFLYGFPFFLGLYVLRLSFGERPHSSDEADLPLWLRFTIFVAALIFARYLSEASLVRSQMADLSLPYEEVEKLFAKEDAAFALFNAWGPWLLAITLVLFLFGFPIFATLSWVSYTLFNMNLGQVELIPNAFYTLYTGEGTLSSLPLFALAGFILSEGKSSERLVHFLRHLCRNIPGGIGVVVIVTNVFFTVVTGASGVTILALGGLLYGIMRRAGYSKPYTIGLLTTSGSVGLFFPPSLPVIIYGTKVGISIKSLFIANFIPGSIIAGSLIVWVVLYQLRQRKRYPAGMPESFYKGLEEEGISYQGENFGGLRDLARKGLLASGEMFLPIFILVAYFYFKVTAREISALTVCYSLVLTMLVHRDFSIKRLLPICRKLLITLGGILMVVGFARSYSDHFVFYDFQGYLQNLIQNHITGTGSFLLLVNLVLLLVGCFLDIFSAILIIAPLINDLSSLFDIAKEQIAVIFLANLELGYITPPVGLSLFLAAYRFNVSLLSIYRYVFPFFLLSLFTVLLITYVPWLSTWLLALFPS